MVMPIIQTCPQCGNEFVGSDCLGQPCDNCLFGAMEKGKDAVQSLIDMKVAEEREACARLVEGDTEREDFPWCGDVRELAKAIRARGRPAEQIERTLADVTAAVNDIQAEVKARGEILDLIQFEAGAKCWTGAIDVIRDLRCALALREARCRTWEAMVETVLATEPHADHPKPHIEALLDKAKEAAGLRATATWSQGVIDTIRYLRDKVSIMNDANAKLQCDIDAMKTEPDAELAKLRAEIRLHRDKANGEYWAWQGDGDDHLESLVCPVLIPPEVLRLVIAERDTLRRDLDVAKASEKETPTQPDIPTPEEIAVTLKLCERASPPPWEAKPFGFGDRHGVYGDPWDGKGADCLAELCGVRLHNRKANSELMAHARIALPRYARSVQELTRRLEEAESILRLMSTCGAYTDGRASGG